MPIYDFITKNTSFLDVHYELKRRGIKNNAFHLTLMNPDLQGVDPYAKDLTTEQMKAIIKECSENITYYLREVLRIQVNGSAERHMFHLDIASASALYCFMLNTTFELMKPKFCHHTMDVLALLSHAFKFGTVCEDYTFIADEKYLSRQNLKIMRSMLEEGLPDYMVDPNLAGEDFNVSSVKVNDVNTYIDPVSRNVVVASNSPTSKDQAENIGRGCSSSYIYLDEFERIKHADSIMNAMIAPYAIKSTNADRYGLNHCMILTSKPGKLDDPNCVNALKVSTRFVRWKLELLDLSKEEFLAYVKNHSLYKGVFISFNYNELGLDETWFKHSCQLLGGIPDRIEREILLKHI